MTGEASEPAVVEFRDDEDGYIGWVRGNRGGWVINAGRNFAPSDGLRLHRAICDTIRARGTTYTSGDFVKACSADRAALVAWARRVEWVRGTAEPSTGCSACSP